MTRSRSGRRRNVGEWTVRGLLAAGATALAYISVTQTSAYGLRPNGADEIDAPMPGNGRITALAAQQLAGANATTADRMRADNLARTALRQDPTAVIAAITLGLDTHLRGDTNGARRLFSYADRLSRRELQTQLWMIEDAVGRNDVPAALRQYDIALRTSRNAAELLFPVLAVALSELPVRRELLKVLAGSPVWGPSFLNFASANADPRAAVALFANLARQGLPVTDEPSARVVGVLLSRGLVKKAWAYYASIRPGTDPRKSRDARFIADHAIPTPFDWVPVNDGGVSTSIQRIGDAGAFDFSAPASVGGPLLRQVQVLPPGDYRLSGQSSGIDQGVEGQPYWMLSCNDGRELGRVDAPSSQQVDGGFAGNFTVPPGCPMQVLMLVARPVDRPGGLSGQITQVHLTPSR